MSPTLYQLSYADMFGIARHTKRQCHAAGLVAGPGIGPRSQGYEPCEMPFLHPAKECTCIILKIYNFAMLNNSQFFKEILVHADDSAAFNLRKWKIDSTMCYFVADTMRLPRLTDISVTTRSRSVKQFTRRLTTEPFLS
jgi:hypothetical protein